MVRGERQWVNYWQPLVDADDFKQVGAAFEQGEGVRYGRVGQAEARLMKVRSLVDFAVPWFQQHREI